MAISRKTDGKENKIQKFFSYASFFLGTLFLFTFFPAYNSKTKEKYVESAILNPKNKNSVSQIFMQETSSEKNSPNSYLNAMELQKKGGLWILKAENSMILANQREVQFFVEKISEIKKFYKISNTRKGVEKLNLYNSTSADFSLTADNNTVFFNFEKLSYGRIFLRSDRNMQVFETQDSKLAQYLTTNLNFWADYSLVPENVFSMNNSIQQIVFEKDGIKKTITDSGNIKKLLNIRHGRILIQDNAAKNTHNDTVYIYFGDTSQIIIQIIPYNEENYQVSYTFMPASQIEKERKEAVKNLNYSALVSHWTMQKVFDVLESK